MENLPSILQFLESRFVSFYRILASIIALSALIGLRWHLTALQSLGQVCRWVGYVPGANELTIVHRWIEARAGDLVWPAVLVIVAGIVCAYKFPRFASLAWLGVGVCSELRNAAPFWLFGGLVIALIASAIFGYIRRSAFDDFTPPIFTNVFRASTELFYAGLYLPIAPVKWLAGYR